MYCSLRYLKKILKLLFVIQLKYILVGGCCLIFICYFFGFFTHVFELPFDDNFVYPYNGNIHEYVAALQQNEEPAVPPINVYNYRFIYDIKDKCLEPTFQTLRIVLLVKSAMENFNRRMAIRKSWGFEKRFSDVPMRTIFLLGTHYDNNELKAKVIAESTKYKDIVQADFLDSYYNNTIKTMMGFQWVQQYCSKSKYYMFVDDDMYVSVKNILTFLRNPTLYPDYLKDSLEFDKRDADYSKDILNRSMVKQNVGTSSLNQIYDSARFKSKINIRKLEARKKRQIFDFELPDDVRLFAGYVFMSAPHRHLSSKWYVSLKEYPYDWWPPYVTAGAYILSKQALLDMYFASMYTKHFKFDDIFLAFVAKKVDIEPFHCEEFHFYKKKYTKYNYKYVLSSHGYDDPDELMKVWNEQKSLGNA